MRLLKTDRAILEAIRTQDCKKDLSALQSMQTPISTGMHVKAICKSIYGADKANNQRSNINKRLRYLFTQRIVIRIGDVHHQPILWKINPNRQDIIWIQVFCPKPECHTQRLASSEQTIAYCANKECTRPNGERTRFHITEDRIDDYKPLLKLSLLSLPFHSPSPSSSIIKTKRNKKAHGTPDDKTE